MTLTHVELSKLALVQHLAELRQRVVLTFDDLVQLLGLKRREEVTNVLVNYINSIISPVAGLFQNTNLGQTRISLG